MLAINRLTDYAILIMARMAAHPDQSVQANALADQIILSYATVRKLLKILAHHGLLISSRGPKGGFRLARPPGEISLADVMRAMGGPMELTQCCAGQHAACGLTAHCTLQGHWQRINQGIHALLAATTLAHLAIPYATGESAP